MKRHKKNRGLFCAAATGTTFSGGSEKAAANLFRGSPLRTKTLSNRLQLSKQEIKQTDDFYTFTII